MESNAGTCNALGAVTLPLVTHVNSFMEEPLGPLSWGGMPALFSDMVLQSLKDPVVMIGHDFRILWANRASTRSEEVGKSCYETFQGRREPCARCPVEAMFGSGEGDVVEKWIPLSNGSGKWLEVRIYPVSDQGGQIVCAFKISFDVTHRRHAFEKQRKYIETLERTVRQMGQDSPRTLPEHGDTTNPRTRLSRRELEVLRLMTEGFANSEISHMLSISAHTVKTHVIHIFNKLGVADRAQAAVRAIRLGIVR